MRLGTARSTVGATSFVKGLTDCCGNAVTLSLTITLIIRLYDKSFVFLLKPTPAPVLDFVDRVFATPMPHPCRPKSAGF